SLFDQLTLSADNVTLTPGQSTLTTIASASLTFAPLNDLAVTVDDLEIDQTGFTIGSASATLSKDLVLGDLLTLKKPTVKLTTVPYVLGGDLRGEVDFSTGGASLDLGGFSATIGSVTSSYSLATHALSVTSPDPSATPTTPPTPAFSLSILGFADISASALA